MIISRRENITKNILCDEIYGTIVEELKRIAAGEVKARDQVEGDPQKNPFVERSSSQESIDTFVPVGSLRSHIKEKMEVVFGEVAGVELSKLIEMVSMIKSKSFGKKTRFCINTEHFLIFLKAFQGKQSSCVSPVEKLVQLIEIDRNRSAVLPLAVKYFKLIFLLQRPTLPTYYEVSIMYNMMKMEFQDDIHMRQVVSVMLREFILGLVCRYVSGLRLRLTRTQTREFSETIETTINAFNGIIAELNVETDEIAKIIYIMLCFHLNKYRSEFQKNYGVRELFYCAVRAVHQGRQFGKQLECFITTKLRWKMKADEEEFTCDKIYQTLFKSEYRKIVGRIVTKSQGYMKYSGGKRGGPGNSSSSEENQRVLITKIVQTTPKINKTEERYAFSPLSRRIAKSLQDKDNLDSKRKLKFDE